MAASKDARKAAAKKRATARAKGTAASYGRPGKVEEAGVSNIPASVARAAMTIAKHMQKSKSKSSKPTELERLIQQDKTAKQVKNIKRTAESKRQQGMRQSTSSSAKPGGKQRVRPTADKMARSKGYTVGGREARGQVNPARRTRRDTPPHSR